MTLSTEESPEKPNDVPPERDSGHRLFMQPLLVFVGLACLSLILAAISVSPSDFRFDRLLSLLSTIAVVGGAATAMLQYLQRDSNPSNLLQDGRSVSDGGNYPALLTAIMRMQESTDIHPHETTDIKVAGVSPEEIRQSVYNELKKDLGAEFAARFSESAIEEAHLNAIQNTFQDARRRLLDEIDALGRRGNLNLVLGSCVTISGLMVLGYFFLTASATQFVWLDHLPRITLVLFVQLFGFFFLRLYRSTLDSIKYFQNELTNVEVKYIAMTAAVMSGDKKVLGSVIASFAQIERNFLLKKGETTVELEKMKIDQDGSEDLATIVSNLVSKIPSQNGKAPTRQPRVVGKKRTSATTG